MVWAVVEEATVFVIGDDQGGLFPHRGIGQQNPQHIDDRGGADRDRKRGMFRVEKPRKHPGNRR